MGDADVYEPSLGACALDAYPGAWKDHPSSRVYVYLCVCVCVCVCVSCVQDKLLRHLRRMRMVYGPVYDFFPPSYILPRERAAFEAEMAAQTEQVHGMGLDG